MTQQPETQRPERAGVSVTTEPAPVAGTHPQPSEIVATVRIINPSRQYRRRDVVERVIPFARGELPAGQPLPALIADNGAPIDYAPIGLRWPDGSVRHVRAYLPVVLEPSESKVLRVLRDQQRTEQPDPNDFRHHPAITPTFRVDVVIEGRVVPLALTLTAQGRYARVFELEGLDLSSGVWANLMLDVRDTCPHVRFSFRWGWNDERTPDMAISFANGVALSVRGAAPIVRDIETTDVVVRSIGQDHHEVRVMHPGDVLGDGQGPEVHGVFLFGLATAQGLELETLQAESELPTMAVAQDWHDTNALGPFGFVPLTPGLANDPARLEGAAIARATQGWNQTQAITQTLVTGPHACNRRPADTGDQADFGAMQLHEVVESGHPAFLHVTRFSAGREAVRPFAFRDLNGRRILARLTPPGWLLWGHYPHYHPGVCTFRRGKPGFPSRVKPHGVEEWDRQHDSVLFLAATALLSGDRRLADICEDWAQTYIAGHPIGTSGILEGIGAPRGLGRTTQSAVWVALATGSSELLDHVKQRWQVNVAAQWHSRANAQPIEVLEGAEREDDAVAEALPLVVVAGPDPRALLNAPELGVILPTSPNGERDERGFWLVDPADRWQLDERGRVVDTSKVQVVDVATGLLEQQDAIGVTSTRSTVSTVAVAGPDPRALLVPYWSPWQDSFVVCGGASLLAVAPDSAPYVRPLLELVSRSVALHATWQDPTGRWHVGAYIAWNNGEPVPDASWQSAVANGGRSDDGLVTVYHPFGRWMLPAWTIGLGFALEHGDTEWSDRCRALLRQWLVTDRRTVGAWDDVSEWVGAVLPEHVVARDEIANLILEAGV